MPQMLEGSCHCGAVRFTVESSTPVPYQLCVCSICRKVGGTGGSVNLGAHSKTLNIKLGKEDIRIYKAVMNRDTKDQYIASSERSFCSKCGTMLWLYDETWPELLHPFASCIDTPLMRPKKMVIVCNSSKPDYVPLPDCDKEVNDKYGQYSLEEWHKVNGLYVE